jgi:transcription factor TFIIIB component B''
VTEDISSADTSNVIAPIHTQDIDEIEDSTEVRHSLDKAVITRNDGVPLEISLELAPSPPSLEAPATSHHVIESIDSDLPPSEDLSVPVNPDLSILGPGESELAAELVPTAELNPDGTSGAVVPPVLEKTAERPSKRRKLDKNGIEIRQSIEVQVNKPRRVPTGKRARRSRDKDGEGAKRKRREETPEDAEEQEVDHRSMKMADLTKDLRIGKKFSRHTELKRREIEKRMKAKLARDHPELARGEANGDEAPSGTAGPEEEPIEANSGPQMRIVNGQIVIDDTSLVVDRHAAATAVIADMEEVEEDEFSRITTSGTFMKRERNIYWDAESNDKFYKGLRMFGTDFEMISKMFPDRNRRQIKLKFNKEERENPRKISNTLIGETMKIDMEEYKSHTGLEYEESDDIKAEQAKLEEEHKAEQLRMQEEAAETTRQKKAEIHGRANRNTSDTGTAPGTEAAGGIDSAKENEPVASGAADGGKAGKASKPRKRAAPKKKKRNPYRQGGGEEVEVLGSIDDLQT